MDAQLGSFTMACNDNAELYSFEDPKALKDWAIVKNKLFDVDVRNRLMQLEKSLKVCGTKVSVIYSLVSLKHSIKCIYLFQTYCRKD